MVLAAIVAIIMAVTEVGLPIIALIAMAAGAIVFGAIAFVSGVFIQTLVPQTVMFGTIMTSFVLIVVATPFCASTFEAVFTLTALCGIVYCICAKDDWCVNRGLTASAVFGLLMTLLAFLYIGDE